MCGTHQSNALLQDTPDTDRGPGEHGRRQRRPGNQTISIIYTTQMSEHILTRYTYTVQTYSIQCIQSIRGLQQLLATETVKKRNDDSRLGSQAFQKSKIPNMFHSLIKI